MNHDQYLLADSLRTMLYYYDQQTCTHEETTRGGVLWTICDSCGKKWADDEGGFKPYKEPEYITTARTRLLALTVKPPEALCGYSHNGVTIWGNEASIYAVRDAFFSKAREPLLNAEIVAARAHNDNTSGYVMTRALQVLLYTKGRFEKAGMGTLVVDSFIPKLRVAIAKRPGLFVGLCINLKAGDGCSHDIDEGGHCVGGEK